MEQVAVVAEMKVGNLTEPNMGNYQRKKRFMAPIIWDLNQSGFNPETRTPVVAENLHPQERWELCNVSQELAAQINRTSEIIQGFLNTGFGLSPKSNFTEINQILHKAETDLIRAIEALPRNVSQIFLNSIGRSQRLSSFAFFSLIMAVILAVILVAGIKMTSIIDPEDLDSDALHLNQVDPQGPVAGEETS
jgi:hypothetical protein